MPRKKTEKPLVDAEAEQERPNSDFLVVGIGASAGGVEALKEFFAAVPSEPGMAFVVVLHLSPRHESNLAQIIQAYTSMPVAQVTRTVKVHPNRVYVIPPNRRLAMTDGVITVQKAEKTLGTRIVIDLFFRTLADAYGRNAVCIVLSGSGSDGTIGLKRVKENNGFAIVQDPDDAAYDSMPRSAIATNLVDWVLPVREMPEKLVRFRESSERLNLTNPDPQAPVEIKGLDELRDILTLIRVKTGHDFSHYKQATLMRRIARHLQIHNLTDIRDYLALLREKPEDMHLLVKNLLINVTNFFRDPEAFEALEKEVIPGLFAGKSADDTVRVWSVGCASGEEAYSLAILLSEYALTLNDPPKVQVFATDVDDDAIAEARDHRYPDTIGADVSPERLRHFFVKEGSNYRVRNDLREIVLFAPHNVLRDPPFSRLDLITCRNMLIYLNRETQDKVLQIFHFALAPDGYLFLGNSESAESQSALYVPVDKKQRIYKRRPATVQKPLPVLPLQGKWEMKIPYLSRPADGERALSFGDVHYKLVEQYAPPSVLVNEDFEIVHLSESAGRFLRFAGGEPSNSLLKAVHPDLLPDLRAALFSARHERKTARFENISADIDGNSVSVNLIVKHVEIAEAGRDFLLVIFVENLSAPAAARSTADGDGVITDKDNATEAVVRRLEEELRRTKDRLRSTIEQHDTSIEELKASNEELQAINEELRSASEELETSKEELQSMNEELATVNQELKEKIDETSRANSDLQNLMASTNIGTIFLDRALQIKRYTPVVEDLFNIIPTDIGRPLSHLTHKLDHENCAADAAEVLRTLRPIEREIKDREGFTYMLRVLPYRTVDDKIGGVVLTFINISETVEAQQAHRWLAAVVAASSDAIISFGGDNRILSWNPAAERIFGYPAGEVVGRPAKILAGKRSGRRWAEILERVWQGESISELDMIFARKDGAAVDATVALSPIANSAGARIGVTAVVRNISERKELGRLLASDLEDMQLLIELGARLVTAENTSELYDRIVKGAVSLMRADAGTLQIYDEHSGELVMRASEGFSATMTKQFARVAAGSDTSYGIALASGERSFIEFDAAGAPDADGSRARHVKAGYLSAQSTPLITRSGRRIGMLSTHWAQSKYRPPDRQVRFFDLLARQAADLVEQQSSGSALRESDERLKLIVGSIKDYAIVTTSSDGIVTGWNPGAEAIFGYTAREIIGKSGHILFTPEDVKNKMPEDEMRRAREYGRAEDERWHLRKDGSRFYASGVMSPLMDGRLGGYVKVARDQTQKIAAEAAVRDQKMLRLLVAAQEEERQRIARDLHDQLGQQLTALRLKLESLKTKVPDARSQLVIQETQEQAKKIDDDVSFLAWELRPTVLDDLGLRAALDNFTREWSRNYGIAGDFHSTRVGKPRLAPEIEINLYRIAQEALNNVMKHAKASRASVLLEVRKDTVVLIIEDDGVGFDPDIDKRVDHIGKGLGLIGMRERAAIVGGTLEIESSPGGGTTVFAQVPMRRAPDKQEKEDG